MFFINRMVKFCKNLDCPSSEELISYKNNDVSATSRKKITNHICSCDFCGAEVEFYANYSQAEENVSTEEIPTPLFELAESILNNKNKGSRLLTKLMAKNKS